MEPTPINMHLYLSRSKWSIHAGDRQRLETNEAIHQQFRVCQRCRAIVFTWGRQQSSPEAGTGVTPWSGVGAVTCFWLLVTDREHSGVGFGQGRTLQQGAVGPATSQSRDDASMTARPENSVIVADKLLELGRLNYALRTCVHCLIFQLLQQHRAMFTILVDGFFFVRWLSCLLKLPLVTKNRIMIRCCCSRKTQ